MKKYSRIAIIVLLWFVSMASLTACHGYNRGVDGAFHWLAEDLDLQPEQQAKLDTLQTAVNNRIAQRKKQHLSGQHDTLLNLLDADSFNQAKAKDLMQEHGKAILQKRIAIAEEMIPLIANFTDSLTAEQRAQLKKNLQDAPFLSSLYGHRHGRHDHHDDDHHDDRRR